eukprot:3145413-Rhodomonas_salina.2
MPRRDDTRDCGRCGPRHRNNKQERLWYKVYEECGARVYFIASWGADCRRRAAQQCSRRGGKGWKRDGRGGLFAVGLKGSGWESRGGTSVRSRGGA